MRKSYDECIEMGNDQSLDQIVDQAHVLRESLRHFFSRACFGSDAANEDTMAKLPEPYKMNDQTLIGLFEQECEGIIWFVTESGSLVEINDIVLDEQVEIACALKEDNSEYGD